MVQFHEIISSKDLTKRTAGDWITHDLRGQRTRLMIVLVNEFFRIRWNVMNG